MGDEKKDRWEWWSGRDGESFNHGPFDSRDDAIQEALSQSDYEEIEHDDGSWSVGIHVAEHKGTYYECDECGVVEKACDACAECLEPGEPRFFFAATRNDEFVMLPHPDDDGMADIDCPGCQGGTAAVNGVYTAKVIEWFCEDHEHDAEWHGESDHD